MTEFFRSSAPLQHAFRFARSPVNLLLSTLAVLVLILGLKGLAYLPFAPDAPDGQKVQIVGQEYDASSEFIAWPWESDARLTPLPRLSPAVSPYAPPTWTAQITGTSSHLAWMLLTPVRSLLSPVIGLTSLSTDSPIGDFAWNVSALLWFLIVWGIFGGAVTRRVALQFTREEHPSTKSVLEYSSRRIWWYVLAPLLGLCGLAAFWLMMWIGGLIGRIPGLGPVIIGALYFLPMIVGFLAALLAVGLILGWALMIPAISVQGVDAFDGFSRAYSYVFGRPWRFAFLVLYSLALGVAAVFVGVFILDCAISFAADGIGTAMSLSEADRSAMTIIQGANFESENPVVGFVQFWLKVFALTFAGFLYSWFWSSSTLLYLVLRKIDDATDVDEIFLPDDQPNPHVVPVVASNGDTSETDIPVAGVANSDQPVIERPVGEIASDTLPSDQSPDSGSDTKTPEDPES